MTIGQATNNVRNKLFKVVKFLKVAQLIFGRQEHENQSGPSTKDATYRSPVHRVLVRTTVTKYHVLGGA